MKAVLGVVAMIATAHAEVPVTEQRLANGLRVILAPDPSVSAVAIDVRYGVGAADETPAQAGYARVVERLLFAGSVHVADFDARIEAAGGWTTSASTVDHVGLVDHVPAGALALALWLEAERMASLPLGVDDARLARATAEVAAERRAAYGDHGYGLVARAVQQAVWGDDPNAHLVLGDAPVTRDGVLAFARAYFVPANATLVIAGRFDPARATELVRRYFAWIPGGARQGPAPAHPLPLRDAREVETTDPVPKVVVAFRAGAPDTLDEIALEVALDLLASGHASRLARRLAGEVSDVHAEVLHQQRGSELRIWATPLPGHDLAPIAAAIRDELQRLHDAPAATDDLERAKATFDAELIAALENLPFRAQLLADWAAYTGDAAELEPLRAAASHLTPPMLHQTCAAWLDSFAVVTVLGR